MKCHQVTQFKFASIKRRTLERSKPDWSFFVAVFFVALVVNSLWEMLQMSAYAENGAISLGLKRYRPARWQLSVTWS